MAYDEGLADRVRGLIGRTHKDVEEKRMFGGLCFMVNNKMCVGVRKDLMVRFDPADHEDMMKRPGCRPMDFTGRAMKGFVYVDRSALDSDDALEFWIKTALDYNKTAKPSRKRKSGR